MPVLHGDPPSLQNDVREDWMGMGPDARTGLRRPTRLRRRRSSRVANALRVGSLGEPPKSCHPSLRLGDLGSVALKFEQVGQQFLVDIMRRKEGRPAAHVAIVSAEGAVTKPVTAQHHIGNEGLHFRKHIACEISGGFAAGYLDSLQQQAKDLLAIEQVRGRCRQDLPNRLDVIAHRDIKPDNMAVGMIGRGDLLHLVLFDFSLSRTPPENVEAGTKAYLDPFLALRKRWDLAAERYAAAVTLFEMTTGTLPVWGDGRSEPSQLECEATLDAELFDPVLRDTLVPYFTKALRRNVADRFDNAEIMLNGWRECFTALGPPDAVSEVDQAELRRLLDEATFDSSIHEIGLGTRAINALDRANVLTVEDLLGMPMRRLLRLRGVGNKTRREWTPERSRRLQRRC